MKLDNFFKAMATLVLLGIYSVNTTPVSAQSAGTPSEKEQSAGQLADKPDTEASEQTAPKKSKSKPARANQRRAWLGVELLETPGGVRIGSVVVDGPAFQAGVRPGDKLVSVDNTETPNAAVVVDSIGKRSPGDEVAIELIRGSERHKIIATLGAAPSGIDRVPFGKALVPSDLRLETHLSPEMEQMQRRIEALEKQVESLRREISELRDKKNGSDEAPIEEPKKASPTAGAIEL